MNHPTRDHPIPADRMGHLIRDTAPLELYSWVTPDARGAGMDALEPPADQLMQVQNYFAEYHLEYFRQRMYDEFPSRLHAQRLFATRTDAMGFAFQHPQAIAGRMLSRAQSAGTYTVSFHDACWLDYLRLPHSLTLETLDEISGHYWCGKLAEEVNLSFENERWCAPPIIEALFVGTLEPLMA